MKKTSLLISGLLLMSQIAYAQLTVDANGHVGIGTDSTSFNSNLVVGDGTSGYSGSIVDVVCKDNERGINVNASISNTSGWTFGVYSRAHDPGHKSVGVLGYSQEAQSGSGRTFGVIGFAGNGNGGNFGVCGNVTGQLKGVGVLGTDNVNWGVTPNLAFCLFL